MPPTSPTPGSVAAVEPRRERWPMRLARWGYRLALGDVVRLVAVLMLGLYPTLNRAGYLTAAWWLWLWTGAFLFKTILWDRYLNGFFADTATSRLADVHGSLAGSIDTLARTIAVAEGGRLTEEECQRLCVGLLHRIKDYVPEAMKVPPGVRLRATLAVPVWDPPRMQARALRVWCYDETYPDRRWTTLPLRDNHVEQLPGAPRAFVTGRPQVIDDIHALGVIEGLEERNFRSVLSVPVKTGGPGGPSLGVVSIDATRPNFFRAQQVQDSLLPLIGPTINLLGLALLTRREDAKYAFGN